MKFVSRSGASAGLVLSRHSLWRTVLPSLVLGTSLAALAALPGTSLAQELRGTVLLPDNVTPASGVVLVMLHATRDDSIVARTVTSDRGRFSLKPQGAGVTRVRVLRIGFEPMDVGRFTLGAGEIRDTTFAMSDLRVRLAARNVQANTRCEVRPSGAQLVGQLFEAARTALIASTATVTGTSSNSQYVSFERTQDRRGQLYIPVKRVPGSGASLRAFGSIGADTLDRRGYVIADKGLVTNYYAPDANVLLSDTFLAQHCLALVEGTDSLAGLVGIGFRPTARRSGIVDVRGTLWLDKATSELQFLEYEYESLPEAVRNAGLGGRVDYARTANGAWFVSSWSIRMPLVEYRETSAAMAVLGASSGARAVVVGQQVTGAEVESVSVDGELLYLNTHAVRAGEMPQDVRAATADVASAAVGSTGAGLTADLDSLGITRLCATATQEDLWGFLEGRVLDLRRSGVPDITVRAEWKSSVQLNIAARSVSWRTEVLETSSNAIGSYNLCGVPVSSAVTLMAKVGSRRGHPAVVRLSRTRPAAQVDLQWRTSSPPL